MSSETQRYQFGVREKIGLVGTLRKGQIATLGCGVVPGFVVMLATKSIGGLVFAAVLSIAAAVVAMYPIRGRTLEQWIPVKMNWLLRRGVVQHGYRSRAATAGVITNGDEGVPPAPCLPPELVDIEILETEYGRGKAGVIRDRRRHTYTAILKVAAGSFGFQNDLEKDRRLNAFGVALAAATKDGSAIRRIQWIERTLPKGGDEMASYLQRERDETVGLEADFVRSYIDLINEAAPTAQEHEIYLAVQVDMKSSKRLARRADTPEEGALTALFTEVETFAENISRGDVIVDRMLGPRRIAGLVRDGFDPWGRETRARAAVKDPDRAGTDPDRMGPTATEAEWTHYRTDGAVHIAYWIEGWPRIPVRSSFMLPLLMQTHVVRAVSVVMEPVPFSTAVRKAEALQAAEAGDEVQRMKHGFVDNARIRRRREASARKDEELAAGHGEMRFAGYIVVSGKTIDEAETNGLQIERAALQTGLQLQRMDGEHDQAFSFVLPLGRGLA